MTQVADGGGAGAAAQRAVRTAASSSMLLVIFSLSGLPLLRWGGNKRLSGSRGRCEQEDVSLLCLARVANERGGVRERLEKTVGKRLSGSISPAETRVGPANIRLTRKTSYLSARSCDAEREGIALSGPQDERTEWRWDERREVPVGKHEPRDHQAPVYL